MLHLNLCGSSALLLPRETAASRQEGLIVIRANQDALQNLNILLCRDSKAIVRSRQGLPAAAEDDAVTQLVVQRDGQQLCD